MKRICGFICVLVILLSVLCISVFASQIEIKEETVDNGSEETLLATESISVSENDTTFAETEQAPLEKEELPEDIFMRSGMGFSEDSSYYPTKPLNDYPNTIEVWLKFPSDYSGRGGVVIGNYGGTKACINFEIYTNGIPRLYCTDSFGNVYDYVFNKVDIRRKAWINVSLVNNIELNRVECYVNGELIQTIEGAYPQDPAMLNSGFSFGGDLRSGNPQYFKGGISSVALFSSVKNSSEIIADMISIDDCAPDLIAHYEVSPSDENCDISDSGMNGYDLYCERRWMTSKYDVGDYAYSFCVVGDTQILARYYPENFHSIYDWIVANRYSKKIEFVFGLGDITDADTSAEWALASGQISRLNGLVPYSLVKGNHDGSGPFNQYFNNYAYTSQFNGFFEAGKIDNSWRTFSVCGVNYLLLALDYGPSDAVLSWAGKIIESHPNHRVIITTHSYLFRDGTTLDMFDEYPPNPSGANDGKKNNGDQMWDKLISKYSNIFLVLSGHDPSDNIVVTQSYGDQGNLVTQMLIDPQEIDRSQGGGGACCHALFFARRQNSVYRVFFYYQK
ncbi:MAG: metallophosphoesterase [Clostridia bacterium]|nr:metallophosphoesterase [Clostridia bacterium]